jgi:chromosome segregation ATPase
MEGHLVMEQAFVVQRVANKVWSSENAVDQALAEASALMIEITNARQELRLSAGTFDKTTADLVAAISALGQARTALVEMHEELAEVKIRIGDRTKLTGTWDKPKRAPETAAEGFRAVG